MIGATVRLAPFAGEPDCLMCRALHRRDRELAAALPKLGVLLHDGAVELLGSHIECRRPAVIDIAGALRGIPAVRPVVGEDPPVGGSRRSSLVREVAESLRAQIARAVEEHQVDCLVRAGDIADSRDKVVLDLTEAVAARL